ncbi:hypothetical protein Zmor_015546 [Zophobas morio]|uniref:Uncharacterized protein n=1 Tax=Zophobas morio TaxID=2755281 RepID=A0AA38IM98_9CUCU|nr:hypothetical protein Zmor_015546 [Zophobas morio]
MRQVMEPLTNAIKNNDIDNFKDIFLKLPKKFVVRDSNDIFILYEESMNKNRKEIFDFLLAFHGKDDVGTITALNYVLNDQNSVPDYYVNELLKKYSSVRNDEKILVISSREKCVEATKFFLEIGHDVNAQTMSGCTSLQRVLVLEPDINTEELIITLLFYGADASAETERGYNCFELAVQHNQPYFVQEMLFDAIFDNHGHYKLHASILLQLAKLESPLFHQLLKYNIEFALDADFQTVRYLLLLDIEYFKIILQNYEKLCCEIFEYHVLYYSAVQRIHYCSFLTKNVPDIATVFCMDQILTKFDFLLQGTDTLKKSVVDFINTLNSLLIFRYCHGSKSEAEITEIVAYLLTYGLSLVLYMDVEPGGQNFQNALVTSVILILL